MILTKKKEDEFVPHPEGVWTGVCVDVIDLGKREQEYQGKKRVVECVRLVFETEALMEDGRPFLISRMFTASLHQKSRLGEFLTKWRGRPILPGEAVDLEKLINVSATLVVSQSEGHDGTVYAGIDAVSKPTKRIAPSGSYDREAARQRREEKRARGGLRAAGAGAPARGGVAVAPLDAGPGGPVEGEVADEEIGF